MYAPSITHSHTFTHTHTHTHSLCVSSLSLSLSPLWTSIFHRHPPLISPIPSLARHASQAQQRPDGSLQEALVCRRGSSVSPALTFASRLALTHTYTLSLSPSLCRSQSTSLCHPPLLTHAHVHSLSLRLGLVVSTPSSSELSVVPDGT